MDIRVVIFVQIVNLPLQDWNFTLDSRCVDALEDLL